MTTTQEELVEVEKGKEELKKKGYWMRPLVLLEESLIAEEEIYKTTLRTVGRSLTRNITPVFFQDIAEAYLNNQNFSAGSYAIAGFGKTTIMLALSVHCQMLYKKIFNLKKPPKILTSIGRNDTLEAIKNLEEGNILFEDEDPFVSGIESKVSQQSLINIQEIVMRFQRVTYLTASVSAKQGMRKNLFNCYLYPIARKKGERMTLCRVFSGLTLMPLGYIEVKLLPPKHPIQVKHNKKEKEYKLAILKNKGYESVKLDPKELEIYAKDLLELTLKTRELEFDRLTIDLKRKINRLRIERLKTNMRKLARKIPASSDTHNRIIDEAWFVILDLKDMIKAENEAKEEREKKLKEEIKRKEKEIKDMQKAEEKREKEREKEVERLLHLTKLEEEKETIIPPLIDECIQTYKDKKFKPLQIRVFFEERGVSKGNITYCMAKAYDSLLESTNGVILEGGGGLTKKFRFIPIRSIEDSSFFATLEACLEETLARITVKYFKRKMFNAWLLHFREKLTYDMIKREYGYSSHSTFTDTYKKKGWMNVFQTEVLGHLVEVALSKTYYIGYQVIGGKSKCDLLDESTNTQIEVKARTRREPPNDKFITDSEIEHLDKGGNLELCLVSFDMLGTVKIEFFQVKRKGD